MKRLFLPLFWCVLITLSSGIARSQNLVSAPPNLNSPGLHIDSVVRYLEATVLPSDSGEGGYASRVADFARVWKNRVSQNDNSGANMFEQYLRINHSAAVARNASGNCNGGNFSGLWRGIGPDSFATQKLGLLKDIWVDPADTTYLLASGYGGVWKSITSGKNWYPIADNTPVSKGIVSPGKISVNPTDRQHFYVGSNTYYFQVLAPQGKGQDGKIIDHYGNGLLVTKDGGATWQQEVLPLHVPAIWEDSVRGARAYFSPDGQRVYGIHDNRLFFRYLTGSWNEINIPILNDKCYLFEIKFVPTGTNQFDPNHFYLVAHSSSNEYSQTIQILDCHFDPSSLIPHNFTNVALPANLLAKNADGTLKRKIVSTYVALPNNEMLYVSFDNLMYRYNVVQQQWTAVSVMDLSVGEGSIHASTARAGTLYTTHVPDGFSSLGYISVDSGRTFTAITEYFGDPTHGDVRGMYINYCDTNSDGSNDRVYLANDGGIALKPKGVNPLISGRNSCININGKGSIVEGLQGWGV